MDEKDLREFLDKRQPRDNLERYLEDVFKEKLKLRLEKEEKKFIKSGIERLTKEVSVLLLENNSKEISQIKRDYRNAYPGLSFQVHQENIVKVGSMYDKTKNGYPDEFDFVLVLFTFYCSSDIKVGYLKFGYTYVETFKQLHANLRKLLSNDNIKDYLKYEDEVTNRKLIFDSYTCRRGPSSRLKIFYLNGSEKHDIYVDIVIAVRRLDPKLNFKSLSSKREFDAEIAKTGSVLYVNEKLTFTETETRFIRETLSVKHRKAYRLVKYLIHGLRDDFFLDEMLRKRGHSGEIITSQMIKTEVIFHHYNCHHAERLVSPCVLAILECLKYYDSNVAIRSLTRSPHIPHFFRSVEKYTALDKMTDEFHAMQKSKQRYVYEQIRVQPLARTLMEFPEVSEKIIWDETEVKDCACCIGGYLINIIMATFALLIFVVFMLCWLQNM